MCKNALAELEADATIIKRAQWEAFAFTVDADTVTVTNGSYADPDEHTYDVTVRNGVPITCDCPADEYQPGACKHRVAVAIREPVLEAASDAHSPDSTDETTARTVATDGGQLLEADDDADTEPEPEITRHVEPAAQGGATYYRCSGCGTEAMRERDLTSDYHADECGERQ